jgi:hypothetical protein
MRAVPNLRAGYKIFCQNLPSESSKKAVTWEPFCYFSKLKFERQKLFL